MKIIIDRFENEFAVVETENGDFIDMPKSLLPSESEEGSIIYITLAEDETAKRRNEMKTKMNNIFKK